MDGRAGRSQVDGAAPWMAASGMIEAGAALSAAIAAANARPWTAGQDDPKPMALRPGWQHPERAKRRRPIGGDCGCERPAWMAGQDDPKPMALRHGWQHPE